MRQYTYIPQGLVMEQRVTVLETAADVTDEVLDLVETWTDLYDDRIDWEDVFDRVQGSHLNDGTVVEWEEMGGPVERKIQREIRKRRAV